MRIPLSALAGLFLSGGAAFAAGGLSCTSDDAQAAIALNGGVTHGMGGALFQFGGMLEIRDGSIAQDLRLTTFERPHVAQYWLDGQDLRLNLYRERQGDAPHGFAQLIIRTTRAKDGAGFDGSYEVIVFDTAGASDGEEMRLEGRIACEAE